MMEKKLKISGRTGTLSVPRQDAVFDNTNFEILCVCMCERERDTERETETERERMRDRL